MGMNMASADISVTCRLEWEQIEADGQTCENCGDAIYFPSAIRPTININIGDGIQFVKMDGHFFICNSCGEDLIK